MTTPNARNCIAFRVYNKTTGALIGSLAIGDFTIRARCVLFGATSPSSWTHNATLVADSIITGQYWLFFDMPGASLRWMIDAVPTNANYITNPDWTNDALNKQDNDSLFTNLSRAAIVEVSNPTEGEQYSISLNAYRKNVFNLTFLSGNGVPVDFTAYYQLKLGVRTQDQTTKKLDAYHGSPTGFVLQGDNQGNLSIVFPASLGTLGSVADIYHYLAAGAVTSDALYWDVSGNTTDNDETTRQQIVKGGSTVTIFRREFGT